MYGRCSDDRCDFVKRKSIISAFLIIAVLSVTFLTTGCDDGQFNIQCNSLVIYDIQAPSDVLTEEELQNYIADVPSYQASREQINCLYDAGRKDDPVLWKGDKLGVLTTNSRERIQIRISLYGGFFALVGGDEYYVINDSHLSMWNNMICAD